MEKRKRLERYVIAEDLRRRLSVTEMRVCEVAHLVLRPGQLYRFSVDQNCVECRAYERAYEVQPVRRLL